MNSSRIGLRLSHAALLVAGLATLAPAANDESMEDVWRRDGHQQAIDDYNLDGNRDRNRILRPIDAFTNDDDPDIESREERRERLQRELIEAQKATERANLVSDLLTAITPSEDTNNFLLGMADGASLNAASGVRYGVNAVFGTDLAGPDEDSMATHAGRLAGNAVQIAAAPALLYGKAAIQVGSPSLRVIYNGYKAAARSYRQNIGRSGGLRHDLNSLTVREGSYRPGASMFQTLRNMDVVHAFTPNMIRTGPTNLANQLVGQIGQVIGGARRIGRRIRGRWIRGY